MSTFVKLVAPDGSALSSWAKVEVHAGDDVADLADRACTKFRSWNVDASQIACSLVTRSCEDKPSADEEAAALGLEPTWSLTRAGVVPNSFLLVRMHGSLAGACPRSTGHSLASRAHTLLHTQLP